MLVKIYVVLLICFFILLLVQAKIRSQISGKDMEDSIFVTEKRRSSVQYMMSLYVTFSKAKLTKRYVQKLTKRYEIIYPSDIRKIRISTIQTILKSAILSLAITIFVLLSKPTLYLIITTFIVVYFINDQYVNSQVVAAENKLLINFSKYLDAVRHGFFQHGMVDEAIYDTLDKADTTVRMHAKAIYNILTSDDMEEELQAYNEGAPNRFIKTFLALCVLALKYGDIEVDGKSTFITNLSNINQDIFVETQKRTMIDDLFRGATYIAVIPFFFMKPIEKWGAYISADTVSIYGGSVGRLISILIFFATIICYKILVQMKEDYIPQKSENTFYDRIERIPLVRAALRNFINRNYGKSLRLARTLKQCGENLTVKNFYLRNFLITALFFVFCIGSFVSFNQIDRANLINNVSSIANISSDASEKQIDKAEQLSIKYVTALKSKVYDTDEIKKEIVSKQIFYNDKMNEKLADDVLNRLDRYQNKYFKWYQFLASFVLSAGVLLVLSNSPKLGKLRVQEAMEDEVIQYETMILMLMHIKRMTIDEILDWMNSFAFFFKESLRDCIDNYSAGDIGALKALKQAEPFEPFQKLIDNLISTDRIGIEKAFADTARERENYIDKRKQDNEINIKKKLVSAQIIAFVPGAIVLFGYLIGPVALASSKGLMELFKTLNV